MYNTDAQTESPIAYCKCCGCEIYKTDTVFDLGDVFQTGKYAIHTDCLTDSLESNKEKTMQYLFDDLVRLENVFSELLEKYTAWDIFEGWCADDGKK